MPPRPGMPGQPAGLAAPPGPGGFPGAQPAAAANQAGRRTLDPDQMPSPIQVMEEDQRSNGGFFDTREKGHPPPLVTTKFVTRDYGNASPRFMRSTMYYVPSSEDMRKQTGVPFGLVISPMAQVGPDEIEPPVTDFGPSGPVRCIRCKAYMCWMMQFIDGGRRFQCAFCKATTEVPPPAETVLVASVATTTLYLLVLTTSVMTCSLFMSVCGMPPTLPLGTPDIVT